MPKVSKNRFRAWLLATKSADVARSLGIDPSAVRHWRRGHSKPSSKHAVKIEKLTNGNVTLTDIFGRG